MVWCCTVQNTYIFGICSSKVEAFDTSKRVPTRTARLAYLSIERPNGRAVVYASILGAVRHVDFEHQDLGAVFSSRPAAHADVAEEPGDAAQRKAELTLLVQASSPGTNSKFSSSKGGGGGD